VVTDHQRRLRYADALPQAVDVRLALEDAPPL
jgi:hypothetical protein